MPWEFISGVKYTTQILIASPEHSAAEMENAWNYCIRPEIAKDWSIVATILKGVGGTVLLATQVEFPPTFQSFLHSLAAEGRTVVTQVWLGRRPPAVDAVFFPPGLAPYDIVEALHARNGHTGFSVPREQWETFVRVAADVELGLVVSDVGEMHWSVFWHKIADSVASNPVACWRRGMELLRVATALLEKTSDIK